MADIDFEAIYRGIRTRVTELVASQPEEVLDEIAPATPKWRVRDIVSHLAGETADMINGNLDGVATDPWTQAQVDARFTTPVADVLAEWTANAAFVEPVIPTIDPMRRAMLLIDVVTHEHDIRGALGAPGARDSDAVALAFDAISAGIGAQQGADGPLRIVHDAGETVVGGPGEPTAAVRTSRFEIIRAGVGRRSYGQIQAWDWEGRRPPSSMVIARFDPPRAEPLVE